MSGRSPCYMAVAMGLLCGQELERLSDGRPLSAEGRLASAVEDVMPGTIGDRPNG